MVYPEPHLYFIDYSGTLSLEMSLFAERKLKKCLEKCAFSALNITEPEKFFHDIIAPTWEKGSIEEIPYATLITDQILTSLKLKDRQKVLHAAQCLTQFYFGSSIIEKEWVEILQSILSQPNNILIIVTDHYYDAKSYIPFHLHSLGISSKVIESSVNTTSPGVLYIAISSILGATKKDPIFWNSIKENLGICSISSIHLIDDFGANELDFGMYNRWQAIESRKKAIQLSIHKIYHQFPEIIEFQLTREELVRKNISSHIERIKNKLLIKNT